MILRRSGPSTKLRVVINELIARFLSVCRSEPSPLSPFPLPIYTHTLPYSHLLHLQQEEKQTTQRHTSGRRVHHKISTKLLSPMDYSSSLVDVSLDLNLNPLRRNDDRPASALSVKKEWSFGVPSAPANFMGLGISVSSVKEEEKLQSTAGALVEELNRVSAENKKLTEMLTVMCENYTALRNQLMDHMARNSHPADEAAAVEEEVEKEHSPSSLSPASSRKRKSDSTTTNNNDNSTDEESFKRPREEVIKAKISRVYVRTEPSDTGLIVKDGYQWRKYGQKVTRDNPCPRAYFKCSFAPSCPVKKKVQRSVEDQSVVVATYEGEHNHPHPSTPEAAAAAATASSSGRGLAIAGSPSLAAGPATMTLDLTKSKPSVASTSARNVVAPSPKPLAGGIDGPEIQQLLVEQMATSLTKDPNFTAALAAAISGRMLQRNRSERW
ncbi:unnamed protein product [Linum tenue]|uniref:WRKY domain-containing protein n=1 Tax=Linum tenue TaxID=586396 RepID=A0AAV0PTB1_9ROSI|nr:unnamed protein product [Linum tenue]